MTTKMLALAAELTETNPAGAQLLVSVDNAETASEIVEALDVYDNAVLESVTEPVPA